VSLEAGGVSTRKTHLGCCWVVPVRYVDIATGYETSGTSPARFASPDDDRSHEWPWKLEDEPPSCSLKYPELPFRDVPDLDISYCHPASLARS